MLKERRQEQVFHAAKEVFSEKGYAKTKISDIIQRAGIARGTFYLYFDSKQHIFSNLLEYLLEEFDQRIHTIELAEGAPPPLAQLRDNLTRIITVALDEPQLIRTLLHHATGPDEELDRKLEDFYTHVTDRIEWALKLGISMGLVRPCHTRLVAYSILGSIKEVMRQLASQGDTSLDVPEVVESLLSFGLHGVLVESLDK